MRASLRKVLLPVLSADLSTRRHAHRLMPTATAVVAGGGLSGMAGRGWPRVCARRQVHADGALDHDVHVLSESPLQRRCRCWLLLLLPSWRSPQAQPSTGMLLHRCRTCCPRWAARCKSTSGQTAGTSAASAACLRLARRCAALDGAQSRRGSVRRPAFWRAHPALAVTPAD